MGFHCCDSLLQMLKSALTEEPKYLDVAEHCRGISKHFRFLSNLGAKLRPISFIIERPHSVGERQRLDFYLASGRRVAEHIDRRKQRRLASGVGWIDKVFLK